MGKSLKMKTTKALFFFNYTEIAVMYSPDIVIMLFPVSLVDIIRNKR